jgi:hypothetical protein
MEGEKMSDWVKLAAIAEAHQSLAELQDEIIQRQIHIGYDGPIASKVADVRISFENLENLVLSEEVTT